MVLIALNASTVEGRNTKHQYEDSEMASNGFSKGTYDATGKAGCSFASGIRSGVRERPRE